MSRQKTERQPMKLDAVSMRWVLSGCLVLILLGVGVGFYFAYQYLGGTAEEVSEAQAKADSADQRLQQLRSMESVLKGHEQDIEKAAKIAAVAKSYQYQNQVVEDLSRYAQIAGITIQGFNFQVDTAVSAGQQKATTPSPAASGSLKSTKIAIQLSPEVEYERLMHFVNLIEQNLTRMQILGLHLSRSDKAPRAVSSQAINLEVYLK